MPNLDDVQPHAVTIVKWRSDQIETQAAADDGRSTSARCQRHSGVMKRTEVRMRGNGHAEAGTHFFHQKQRIKNFFARDKTGFPEKKIAKLVSMLREKGDASFLF